MHENIHAKAQKKNLDTRHDVLCVFLPHAYYTAQNKVVIVEE